MSPKYAADEAHHLGAEKISNNLPINVPYRLGLSATPERWYDSSGTTKLNEYFTGGVIFRFTLKDAIGRFLTEYYYYPHVIVLTDKENEEYIKITNQIVKLVPKDTDLDLSISDKLKFLLIKRARLINSAENKLKKLNELLISFLACIPLIAGKEKINLDDITTLYVRNSLFYLSI